MNDVTNNSRKVKFPGRVLTIRKFVQEEDRVPWLVENLLPAVGWTLLVGRKGVGKTTFALQLALALQEGKVLFDRVTKQTNVLIAQFDSPVAEWREILNRIAPQSTSWTMINCPAYALDNTAYVSSMLSLITKVQPGFVIWDSLYRLTKKPINTERVGDTIELLHVLCNDIPFMLIHHPPHTETRAAGHHSIGATCSNEWHLLKNKLLIDKGRLVSDKEIMLERDEKGLWQLKSDEDYSSGSSAFDDILDRPMV